MNWREKIQKGMELMAEGCSETFFDNFHSCKGCPFWYICHDFDIPSPIDWMNSEKEEES